MGGFQRPRIAYCDIDWFRFGWSGAQSSVEALSRGLYRGNPVYNARPTLAR